MIGRRLVSSEEKTRSKPFFLVSILQFFFFFEKEAVIESPSLIFVWHEADITVLFGLIF